MDRLIEQARQEFAKRRVGQPARRAARTLTPMPARTCTACGARLTGRKLKWCTPVCRRRAQAAARPVSVAHRWTRELIIARILEWHRRFGRPPLASEWNRGAARQHGYADALAIFANEPGHWPVHTTVTQHFGGSWSAALAAAGHQANAPGRPRRQPRRAPLVEQTAA